MDAIDWAIVLAGGDAVESLLRPLPDAPLVIAADSGLAQAAGLGLAVDLVVGDLDSVAPADLQAAVAAGARVERHPPGKDRTDLEIALRAALRSGARRVTVIGGIGGRLDHLLANALLLAADDFAGLDIEWLAGPARVSVVRRRRVLAGRPGELLTLLAIGGPAVGVRTEGLSYRLDGERLEPGSSRGVSNVFSADRATISLEEGVLLAVAPGEHEEKKP